MTDEAIKALRGENAKYKKAVNDVEAKLALFENIDLVKYQQLQAEVQTMRKEAKIAELHKLAARGDYDAFSARYDLERESENMEAQAQLANALSKIQAMEQERDDDIMHRELSAALEASGAINSKLVGQLLGKLHKVGVRLVDGLHTACVIDESGNPRFDTATDKLVTVKQLMEEMRGNIDYSHLFSDDSVRAGTLATGIEGSQPNPWRRDTRNLTQQGAIMKGSPALAERLKIEAAGSNSTNVAVNPWRRDTRNLTQQGAIFKENPALAERLRKEAQEI